MLPVKLIALMFATLLGASCGVPKPQNCSVKPAEFLYWSDPRLLDDPMMADIDGPQVNVIKIARSGAVTWNGADLTTQHGFVPALELYLGAVAGFEPEPYSAIDFDRGAPCDSIKIVRALMNKHLTCARSQNCIQGPGPREN